MTFIIQTFILVYNIMYNTLKWIQVLLKPFSTRVISLNIFDEKRMKFVVKRLDESLTKKPMSRAKKNQYSLHFSFRHFILLMKVEKSTKNWKM